MSQQQTEYNNHNNSAGWFYGRTFAPDISRCRCEPALLHIPTAADSFMTSYDASSTLRRKPVSPSSRTSSSAPQHQQQEKSNNVSVAELLVGDVLVGLGVTAAFAPTLTAVDKALVHCAARTHTFSGSVAESLRGMAQNPVGYLKSPTFLWMWATYAATYVTANCFNTLADENTKRFNHNRNQDTRKTQQQTQSSWFMDPALFTSVMFVGTTAANSSAALCKDQAYSRMFGKAVTSVPAMSYSIWLARDFTVIGSSFLLPPKVAMLMEHGSLTAPAGATQQQQQPSAQSLAMAQFLTPMAAQLIAGPLHFVGLDYCNRPTGVSLASRWTVLRQGLTSVIAARMVRILPGYGMGGVWNRQGRQAWKDACQDRRRLQQQPSKQQPIAGLLSDAIAAVQHH